MKLDAVLQVLHLEAARDTLLPHWDESMASLPDELPAFMDPERCSALRSLTDMQDEVDDSLVAIARQVSGDPALRCLAWHCYQLTYFHPEVTPNHLRQLPWLEQVLGPNHGLFYALVALGAVPLVQDFHARRGIPEQTTRDTVAHFREALWLTWAESEGGWTVKLSSLYWTRYYAWGDLYSCGRMEYMVRPFGGLVTVLRHRVTGKVLALTQDGHVFTAEGYSNAGETVASSPGNWESSLVDQGDRLTGHPVDPRGISLQPTVELVKADWEVVLQKGDPILDTHIPAGGGFTPELCEQSMRMAVDFFRQYFPDRPFLGFACDSWILDPEIRNWYHPESNMVKWQDELYLFPYPSGPRMGMYFVFGSDDLDLAELPTDTSLRRAMATLLQGGGWCRAGSMFMLTEDLEHYGEQWYLRNWSGELLGLEGPA